MLEQRLNAPFILDEENSPTNYFGSFEAPAMPPTKADNLKTNSSVVSTNKNEALKSFKGVFDAPLKVNFVRMNIDPVTNDFNYENELPANTWSSNLSTYATSSLPYFDDESRNRPPITEPPNIIVVKTLASSLGTPTII